MKGLTLTNPYGQLMMLGAKTIETRSWSTSYRGIVAIHTAKRFTLEQWLQAAQNPRFWPPLARAGYIARERFESQQIIAIGVLVDVQPTTGHCPITRTDERYFGDYSEGRFMWMFDRITKLKEPIDYTGALGLWEIPRTMKAWRIITEQL